MKVVVTSLAVIFVLMFIAMAGVGGAAPILAAPTAHPIRDAEGLEAEVLAHPRISLRPHARGDVEAARVDPRVLAVLLLLAERFQVGGIGPFKTGHSYYVAGTTHVSNHSFGRAVDIFRIDGAPVSSLNVRARDAVMLILSLEPTLRPDEVGSPWRISAAGSFTDRSHRDHIHIGWDSR